jgi:hypothetical protein
MPPSLADATCERQASRQEREGRTAEYAEVVVREAAVHALFYPPVAPICTCAAMGLQLFPGEFS